MTDDLDALLARADQFFFTGRKITEGIVLVGELAAAVRTLRTERDNLALLVENGDDDFDDANVEIQRLRDDYDTALDVIGRLRTGWTDMPMGAEIRWCREGPTEDDPTTIRRWEPMSDAEREVLRRASERL